MENQFRIEVELANKYYGESSCYLEVMFQNYKSIMVRYTVNYQPYAVIKIVYLFFLTSYWFFIVKVYITDHVERKVPKYANHKLRERKVKTLTRNWRDHRRTDTHKHMETVSRYFDRHGRLFQSEESKCMWTHSKDEFFS